MSRERRLSVAAFVDVAEEHGDRFRVLMRCLYDYSGIAVLRQKG
jgi:hypothetical protein